MEEVGIGFGLYKKLLDFFQGGCGQFYTFTNNVRVFLAQSLLACGFVRLSRFSLWWWVYNVLFYTS